MSAIRNENRQVQQVLDYINEHGSIDAWTAIHELNILRLGARIYDLKRLGFRFKTTTVCRKNAEGVSKHWAKYEFATE